jgi:nicotinamidase-related amidase
VATERHRAWQAVVMVDMQRDFFADPELERCREDLTAACNAVVVAALARGLVVVEVRTVHREDGSTWSLNMNDDRAGMTIDGTPGADPIEGLVSAAEHAGITLVTKTRDSAFHDTDLAAHLDEQGVTALLLCGVSTESCIAATATEAYARDLAVGIVLDATASVRWDLHDHALDSLREQYRQPALYAADVIASMAQRTTGG